MENENKKTYLPAGRNTPRDVFLHLLAVVTLYWSAVSFVTLLWQYINKFFPDVLDYFPAGFNEPMRMSIASLLIVFPVFLAVSWYLNKIYSKEEIVRESKIRKWLIYLTLFIASLVIIGDLVTVINTFLNGEIKARFILKALSIIFVAGIIFWYYLDDVRKEKPTELAKPFAWGSGILILITVVCSFFVIGSPMDARLTKFDQQKISDLQNIQYQIVNYYQSKEKLPANLQDLEDPISGHSMPIDPQNSEEGFVYEYNIIEAENLSFELCASFNKEGKDPNGQARPISIPPKNVGLENWQHPVGRHCFERTIDRDLYPPFNKTK